MTAQELDLKRAAEQVLQARVATAARPWFEPAPRALLEPFQH